VRQTAGGASAAAFGGQVGAAVTTVADSLNRISAQTSEAAIKLQERKNAREVMRQYSEYQAAVSDLYRNTKDGLDLTDPEVGANFNAQLQSLREGLVSSNQGGPIAAGQLDKLLGETQSGFSMKLVDDTQKAHDAQAEQIDTAEANRIYQTTFENPTLLLQARENATALAEIANQGSNPQTAGARTRRYESAALEGAMNGLLSQGAWKAVGRILRENPDASAILGEEAFERVLDRMNRLESGVDKSDVTVNINEETEEAFFTTFGEGRAKQGLGILEKADRAQESLTSIQVQRSLLDSERLKPGFGSKARQTGAKALALFGLDDPSLLEALQLGDPAASDAFDAEANKQVSILAQEGSRITNLFIQTIAGRVAQLTMTPDGIDLVLDLREFVHNAVIEEADIWKKYGDPRNVDLEPGLDEELRQLRARKRDEFSLIQEAIVANTDRADQPKSWREVGQNAAKEAAGAAAGLLGPEAEGAAFEPTEAEANQLRTMVGSIAPGFEFAGVTPDGFVKIRNTETGEQGRSQISAQEFLLQAGQVSDEVEAQAEGGAGEEAEGQEAPDDEDLDTGPF
jgi:hypothetical protein